MPLVRHRGSQGGAEIGPSAGGDEQIKHRAIVAHDRPFQSVEAKLIALGKIGPVCKEPCDPVGKSKACSRRKVWNGDRREMDPRIIGNGRGCSALAANNDTHVLVRKRRIANHAPIEPARVICRKNNNRTGALIAQVAHRVACSREGSDSSNVQRAAHAPRLRPKLEP